MTSLLDLPDEVIVYIATHIDITDVLSLRKACRRCSLLSHDRAIWKTIVQSQSRRYPMLRGMSSPATVLEGQTKDLEDLATSVHATATSWLRRHQRPAPSLRAKVVLPGDHLHDMHVVLDRWVVVVLSASYEVWDLYPSDGAPGYIGLDRTGAWAGGNLEPVRRLRDEIHGYCSGSAVCADLSGDAIIVAIACSIPNWDSDEKRTLVRKIRLNSNVTEVQLLGSIPGAPARFVGHSLVVNPSSQLVAFSEQGILCFWHWPTNFYWRVEAEESDLELGVVSNLFSVHFLTPHHLLCLRERTVNLLTLDFLDEVNQSNNQFRADGPQFRGQRAVPRVDATFSDLPKRSDQAIFSESQTIYSEDSKTVSTTFLAYLRSQGLFHYAVEVRFPRTSEPPSPTSLLTKGEFASLPLDIKVTLLAAPTHYAVANSSSVIYGCTLGSQGKRGVWVESLPRAPPYTNPLDLRVCGFAVDDYQPRHFSETTDDDTGLGSPPRRTIQGRPIYEIIDSQEDNASYDDEITHWALSEITGTVVLGTLYGHVLVLNPLAGDRGLLQQ
ncbi:hypothetical protein BC835DRAFT_1420819 [Cytidiella melzeri]|nr:hypothetical protein BC835DRAFT_1420819 [Cytidiella melzeri]